MSERLASTTRDMLAAHSNSYEEKRISNATQSISSPDIDSLASITTTETSLPPPPPPLLTSATSSSYVPFNNSNNNNNNMMATTMQEQQQQIVPPMPPQQQNILPPTTSAPYQDQQQQQGMSNNDIDFNSCEFLYDSALFGQIIFDTTGKGELNYLPPQQQQPNYSIMLNTSTIGMNNGGAGGSNYQQQPVYPQQSVKNNTTWGV
jgi:hypothetical protein